MAKRRTERHPPTERDRKIEIERERERENAVVKVKDSCDTKFVSTYTFLFRA